MKLPGSKTDAIVESCDIFPTLCELTNLPIPEFTAGTSLTPQLENPAAPGHPALAYNSKANTLRTATHRIILHKNGDAELYDHTSPEKETRNIANQHPELVAKLKQQLAAKLAASAP